MERMQWSGLHLIDPEQQSEQKQPLMPCCASTGALDRNGLRCRFGSTDVPAWMEGDIITCCPPTKAVRNSPPCATRALAPFRDALETRPPRRSSS
jgi:hypothetical protein